MRLEEAKSVVEDLSDRYEEMSQGDRTFIEQMSSMFDRYSISNINLTSGQLEKIEKLQKKFLR